MSRGSAQEHPSYWERLYRSRADEEVSWFQAEPTLSLYMIDAATAGAPASVIDVGGGSSVLVDRLLEVGYGPVAVLDVSPTALSRASERLGERAPDVAWIEADLTSEDSIGEYDMWHDRAFFHFLVADADRSRYVRLAERTVPVGGHAIVATFSPDGPDHCSGLEVRRYDAPGLAAELGSGFELEESTDATHVTPAGVEQQFLYARFRRRRSASG